MTAGSAVNSKHFVATTPCKACGTSIRLVNSKHCVECMRVRDAARYVAKGETLRAQHRARYAANPEPHKQYAALWRKQNPEKVRAVYLNNPARHHEAYRRWRLANLDKDAAAKAKRRSAKLQRTPLWVDLEKIKQVYAQAQAMTEMMGKPYHVDHVIPLRGKTVSGLHVHSNLQILPGAENMKKRNRFEDSAWLS